MAERERRAPKRLAVTVKQAEGPPIDLDAWAERYVALLLRLDAEDHGARRSDERRIEKTGRTG